MCYTSVNLHDQHHIDILTAQYKLQYQSYLVSKIKAKMLSELEKQHLTKLTQHYSFEQLRPSSQIYDIVIPNDQIFFKGASERRRRIYYKVDYETKQIQGIKELKAKFQKQNFIHPFGDEVLLKHLYSSRWNIDKTFDRMKLLLQFNTSQKIINFEQQTRKQLQTGKCYCYGHDRGMRPIVIFRLDKFDLSKPFQQSMNQIYFLMLVVMAYKMVPYHAQKYNMIIDLNNMPIMDIPYKYLYECVFRIGVFYCYNAEKTFVYNSQGMSTIWKIISFFLQENQRSRIMFINKGEEKKISEYIDQYQLQRRFGGKLPNLTTFWPPQNISQEYSNKLKNNPSQSVYSVQNDEQFFCEGDSVSIIPCQCAIF